MIVVTGVTGQLGRLVIASLLKRVPANQIVAAARTPSKAADTSRPHCPKIVPDALVPSAGGCA
jgi:uncharacterized protein YbjT (DUF2867 family)